MKGLKTFFYVNYALFILASLLIFFYTAQFQDFIGVGNFMLFMKIWAAIGIILMVVIWLVTYFQNFSLSRRADKLEKERNEIKAKLYDQEESSDKAAEAIEAVSEEPVVKDSEDISDAENKTLS